MKVALSVLVFVCVSECSWLSSIPKRDPVWAEARGFRVGRQGYPDDGGKGYRKDVGGFGFKKNFFVNDKEDDDFHDNDFFGNDKEDDDIHDVKYDDGDDTRDDGFHNVKDNDGDDKDDRFFHVRYYDDKRDDDFHDVEDDDD